MAVNFVRSSMEIATFVGESPATSQLNIGPHSLPPFVLRRHRRNTKPSFLFNLCNLGWHSPQRMVNRAFAVDLNKPLVFQVGHLGETYDEWVHQAVVSKETPRLFANDIVEFLTRTRWWAIPLIWLPVVCWSVAQSVEEGLHMHHLAATIVAGILLWTLMEYCLHRFVFHIKTTSYWGNTLHYLLHGIHHKHPMDGLRLVFPPAACAILLVPLWNLLKFMLPASYYPTLFGGILFGYVMYDCTHYYLHYGKPLTGVSHDLKRYHMNHHFKIQDKGFGITSKFWDRIFGTLPPRSGKKDAD